MFCARLFICALWSPAGKGLTSWLSFVVSSVSLSLSHWYPGSGVVLDCIDSWSLQPYYFYLFKTQVKSGYNRANLIICVLRPEHLSGNKYYTRQLAQNCYFVFGLFRFVLFFSLYQNILEIYHSIKCQFLSWIFFSLHFKTSKWVWSGNTTITNRRQPCDTARKSRSTITRHQEDKLSKATNSLFSTKMIAILVWT